MGTKLNPGEYDCYEKAEPDEPMFILLARDPLAPSLIHIWANMREDLGKDPEKTAEARAIADEMVKWRENNNAPK